MKKNLAKTMTKERNCYGYLVRFSNGRYTYQNDNDLGLDLDAIDVVCSVEKLKCGKGFVYKIRNERGCVPIDDGTGVPFKTALALLKECHEFYDPLTKEEKAICEKYWKRVWGK